MFIAADEEASVIRTRLIDNADSFTLNLFHLFAEVNGCAPTLVPNDWAKFDVSVRQCRHLLGVWHGGAAG